MRAQGVFGLWRRGPGRRKANHMTARKATMPAHSFLEKDEKTPSME